MKRKIKVGDTVSYKANCSIHNCYYCERDAKLTFIVQKIQIAYNDTGDNFTMYILVHKEGRVIQTDLNTINLILPKDLGLVCKNDAKNNTGQ